MSYDIGIGLCTDIKGQLVSVGLDSAMLNKLHPGGPWYKSGTGSLTFNSRLCSTKRELKVGCEVYLDSQALDGRATAQLELAGASDGATQVGMKALLHGLDPMPAPTPTAKRAYGSFPALRGRK